MHTHTKYYRHGLLLLVLFVCLTLPDWASALPAAPAAALPAGMEATIAAAVSKIISILNILTWILFIFLNFVLDPQFIFDLGGNDGLMDMLNEIWQLSRDLMNILFALVLVGTAVYTIVTANKEFVSSHAKKFVLAVVLVNFSWFVPRVIIDISNVAAATIYGIPSLLLPDDTMCKYQTAANEDTKCTVITAPVPETPTSAAVPGVYSCPCRVVVDAKLFLSQKETDDYTTDAMRNAGWECQGTILCYKTKAWSAKLVSGHSAVLNGLIINHAHLGTMAQVPAPTNATNLSQMTKLLMTEAIILLIHVALFFPLLAMFVAFVIRIPILWLTMAFMPFIFLSWVISGEIAGMTDRIWKEFIKAAFLPAMIAIPLSVGFILVNAGDQLKASPVEAIQIRLIDSVNNFWQLLWWMMTLGVMWVGTFMVFEKAGGLYASTANTIKNTGEAWGKLALKAPLSVEALPGIGMTPLAALKTFSPHNLDNEISGPGGIKDALARFRAGGLGAHTGATGAGAAAAVGGKSLTDIELDTLHKDLVKLQSEIASRPADKEALMAAFEAKAEASKVGLKLDRTDTKGSIKAFVVGLKSKGRNGGKVDDINNVADTF